MLIDIKKDRNQTKILLIEDGREISGLSDSAPEFLRDLLFERQIDTSQTPLPPGLNNEEVLKSLRERGFYAAHYSASLVEVELQD